MREKIPFSKKQIIIEVLSLAALLIPVVYLIVSWNTMPEEVPTHFDAMGLPDKWGGKGNVVILPIISAILFLGFYGFSALLRHTSTEPASSRYDTPLVRRITSEFLSVLKLTILLDFGYIALCTAQACPLGAWFLPVFLVLIFGEIIFYTALIIRAGKARNA